ncbi:hypothetical protein OCL06_14805 [Alteromonas sp. ASW11-19]|uniref:Lipoprotein n=1 Tax=Alteromonas salexigens TaxID=2982530 RepID=A0ABT2VRB4_9ALTE|nr:hypothetical protein [Alteromonas salexigens]MCU7555858.1 hypothetical protein [Alteromonas salexigens]
MPMFSRIQLVSCSLAAMLTLGGCSTTSSPGPTPYQAAKTENAYGYSSVQLSDSEYRILFKASENTPADLVQQYTVLRGAEIAKRQGYDWLTVVKTDIQRKKSTAKKIVRKEGREGHVFPPEQQCTMSGCQEVGQPFDGPVGEVEVDNVPTKDVYYSILVRFGDSQVSTDGNALRVSEVLNNRPETD